MNYNASTRNLLIAALMMVVSVPAMASNKERHSVERSGHHQSREHRRDDARHDRRNNHDRHANRHDQHYDAHRGHNRHDRHADRHYRKHQYARHHDRHYDHYYHGGHHNYQRYPSSSYGVWYNVSPFYSFSYSHRD